MYKVCWPLVWLLFLDMLIRTTAACNNGIRALSLADFHSELPQRLGLHLGIRSLSSMLQAAGFVCQRGGEKRNAVVALNLSSRWIWIRPFFSYADVLHAAVPCKELAAAPRVLYYIYNIIEPFVILKDMGVCSGQKHARHSNLHQLTVSSFSPSFSILKFILRLNISLSVSETKSGPIVQEFGGSRQDMTG